MIWKIPANNWDNNKLGLNKNSKNPQINFALKRKRKNIPRKAISTETEMEINTAQQQEHKQQDDGKSPIYTFWAWDRPHAVGGANHAE